MRPAPGSGGGRRPEGGIVTADAAHHGDAGARSGADRGLDAGHGIGPRWLPWALSSGATAIWAGAIVISGLQHRVLANWEAAATMLFGSFLAGSSPLGGGAVAFPVLTKVVNVPGPVARTFGLSIQAVGMTMAGAAIVLSGRRFHRRAAVVGSIAAVIGFLVFVLLLGRPDEPFWPSTIGSAWVKATFSVVLATTVLLMIRYLRPGQPGDGPLQWNRRLDVGLVAAAVAGGGLASITGTGANILVFLFLVALAGELPKVALPTAIMIMAAVSLVGTAVLGVLDGQLDVEVVGGRVVSVGGITTDVDAERSDLLGLWLAAVPVAVWAAPLGSLAASLVKERQLVRFVAFLATIEVVTTFVLVPEMRTEPRLIAYVMAGLVVMPTGLVIMSRRRRAIFG